jgi:threonine dehydrogenase-like Zn-dependent dehydrogenase
MKAVSANLHRRTLDLIERDLPPPLLSPTQVRLRVLDVGICGTDREIARFCYGTPPPGQEQLIIGHEALAEVVQVGADVSTLGPGDLVVPVVRRPCQHPGCLACENERPDFCLSGDYVERGIKLADGFMVEELIDEAQFLQEVPSDLRATAVLVEPLTLAEKAISQYWRVQSRLPWLRGGPPSRSDQTAVVLGAGPVGLLGAMVLRAHGFRTFIVSRGDGPDPRSNFAEMIGATFLSADTHTPDEICAAVGPFELVYEASGASALSYKMLERLGVNGIFIMTGVPGRKHGAVEVDIMRVMKNLVVKNQFVFAALTASREDYSRAVLDLRVFGERWPDAVGSLISGRYPVEAYRDLLLGDSRDMKEVLSFA